MIRRMFVSATFNIELHAPQQFAWGIMDLDLSEPLQEQILNDTDYSEVTNFNIVALNEVGYD